MRVIVVVIVSGPAIWEVLGDVEGGVVDDVDVIVVVVGGTGR